MKISEIARMAGVSSAAVSRYFNNGYLSDEKKEAIRKVVEETGYRPSIQAQMLRTKKTKTIGVIIPNIYSSSMGSVVAGITNYLDENGYRVLLANTENDPKKELEYLTVFDEKQVDGIIFAGTIFSAIHRKAMQKVTVPLVVVGQQIPGFNCVYHDDYHAFYDLTTLFIEKGYKKIGYIGVTEKDRAVGELRYKSYCDALKKHNMSDCTGNVVVSDFTMDSGSQSMETLYWQHPDLEVVICATDRIAVGAQIWCRENNVKIPHFGGQGDTEIAMISSPSITTIHYFYEESGSSAARRVLDMISEEESGRTANREVRLGYHIIDRVPEKR